MVNHLISLITTDGVAKAEFQSLNRRKRREQRGESWAEIAAENTKKHNAIRLIGDIGGV